MSLVKRKQKKQPINLKLYHPDINESLMLIETLENSVQKILIHIKKSPLQQLNADGAKLFIQNTYLLTKTYTPEIIENSIIKIMDCDGAILPQDQLEEAYEGLNGQLNSIYEGLKTIESNVTSMFRSVPVHYRVGYLFRDTNAKTIKSQLNQLIKGMGKILSMLESAPQTDPLKLGV